MKLKTIKLDAATDRQLLDYARTFLQLDNVQPSAKRESLLARIAQAQPGNDGCTVVSTDDEAPEPEHNVAPARTPLADKLINDGRRFDVASSDDPRVVIIIQEQAGLGKFGKRAVPVSANGRTMLIPRGVEADIPYRFFAVLKEAMETHIEDVPDEDNPTKVERVESEVQSYPFQIVSMPSKAELKAWNDKKREDQEALVASQTKATKAA